MGVVNVVVGVVVIVDFVVDVNVVIFVVVVAGMDVVTDVVGVVFVVEIVEGRRRRWCSKASYCFVVASCVVDIVVAVASVVGAVVVG